MRASRALVRPGCYAAAVSGPQRLLQFSTAFKIDKIATAPTPNPNSLKFLTGQDVMGTIGTANFTHPAEAYASPMARSLFGIDGITAIFLGPDFIAVTKEEENSWSDMKPEISQTIIDFYASGEALMTDMGKLTGSDTAILPGDDEVVMTIKELLNTRVRPAVQEDGGDIQYHGFEHGIVLLQLQGACSGCPSASDTLKGGIENMLTHYIPEVKGVSQVLDEERVLTWKTMD